MPVPVLLLSGAGLPAWSWDAVRALLPDVDTVVAERPRGPRVSLAQCADAVAAAAPEPVFSVVAHSLGGVLAAELLARHPQRVAGVLGVAAVVPRPGRSFAGSVPLPARLLLGPLLRLAGTRPPVSALRAMAEGLDAETVDRLVAAFDPEARRLYVDRTSPWAWPPVAGYLATGRDREVVPAVQATSAQALGARWTEELPTGHLPMLEDPAGVARAVRRLLAGVADPSPTARR